jgi:hypothetical protein
MENKGNIYYIAAIILFMSFCDVLAGSDSEEIIVNIGSHHEEFVVRLNYSRCRI